MDTNKYRIDFDAGEYDIFLRYVDLNNLKEVAATFEEDSPFNKILDKINNPKIIKYSHEKTIAVSKASQKRVEQSKEKIENAITELRFKDKKITFSSISEEGKLSILTVKKYVTEERLDALNRF